MIACRYPPYTYKVEYCLTNEVELRVCAASEREAAVGNSFHTGVVALLIKLGLEAKCPGVVQV